MSGGPAHYFAYGSNLLLSRMQRRIGGAVVLSRAWLAGYRVRFNKRGLDGTAKANLAPCAPSRVWGVVYRLDRRELPRLDRIEGGYRREQVMVVQDGGRPLRCVTYRSERVDERQRPAPWYVGCVLDGALQMRLPPEHVRALREAAAAQGGAPPPFSSIDTHLRFA